MVRDEDLYPIGAVVRIKKTGEFALIKVRSFLRDEKWFLNCLVEIESRPKGLYAVYHEDVELEVLPLAK